MFKRYTVKSIDHTDNDRAYVHNLKLRKGEAFRMRKALAKTFKYHTVQVIKL